MSKRNGPAYVVIIDQDGCKECGHGRTFQVVGPDEVALGTTWEDLESAQEMAYELNAAYMLGENGI